MPSITWYSAILVPKEAGVQLYHSVAAGRGMHFTIVVRCRGCIFVVVPQYGETQGCIFRRGASPSPSCQPLPAKIVGIKQIQPPRLFGVALFCSPVSEISQPMQGH